MGVTMAVGRASTQHHSFQWFWTWFLGLSAMFPSKKSSNLHLEPFGWCGRWAKHCEVATSTSDLLWETFQCFLTLDFAELTSVTKLKHFKRSNHINDLTFWGLRFNFFSHRSEKKSDPERWVGCLQNGDFALLWFLEKEWITIGCFQKEGYPKMDGL